MKPLAMLILLLAAASTQARSPALDLERLVPVELATVATDPLSGTPVALLREPISGEVVPIMIGFAEARAILMALREVPVPRPMTHDLIGTLLTATGARLERVMVDALVQDTYLGLLELQLPDRADPVYVDSRPSDALAVAVRLGAPILVAPEILRATRGQRFEGLEEQVVTALGITVVAAPEPLRQALGLPADRDGVLVSRVEGAAAAAGLGPGAFIIGVDGETPRSPMAFLDLVRRGSANEDVEIAFVREGSEGKLTLPRSVPQRRGEEGPKISL